MTDYRALLRDRKNKTSSQTVEHEYCANPDLVEELKALHRERDEITHPFTQRIGKARASAEGRLAGPPDTSPIEAERDAATADIDARIDAKQREIRANSVVLHFQSIGSRYSELSAAHKMGRQDAETTRFTMALLDASFVKVTDLDGVTVDASWEDVLAGDPNDGEIGRMASKVINANLVPVDLPFSLRPSGKTQAAGRK